MAARPRAHGPTLAADRVGGRLIRSWRRLRSHRAAGTGRGGWLLVTALVVVGVVVAGRAWPHSPPPGLWDGSAVRVGVHDGSSVAAYAEASRRELDALAGGGAADGPIYALVSLRTYADPGQVAALVAGSTVAPVVAYARVPLPRRQTEVVRLSAATVPVDLVTAMRSAAARKAADAVRYRSEAAGTTDPARLGWYRSAAEMAETEAVAYRDGCACVFSLVVRATPRRLAGLSASGLVRIVDPAPEVNRLAEAVFVAPLPEQVDLVAPEPDDSLPTPAGSG